MARAQSERWNLVALDMNIELSTPAGEFMAHVLASAAQWERRIISQRTKDALSIKREQGIQLGRPKSTTDELDLLVAGLRADGLSLQAIADRLHSQGIPTPRGGRVWRPSTLQVILRRGQRAHGSRHALTPAAGA
jgi:DNA invertase Pin-like site-specific DNA recombinase